MQVKKEVSVAVFIGLIIGVVIIGGIYRAKTAIQTRQLDSSPTPVATELNQVKGETQPSLPLKIHSPIDGIITNTPKIELSGSTKPGTYITILTETNEYIIVPSDLGNFSQEITLIKGANSITVSVYTPEGDKVETSLNLVYTTADL